MQPGTTEKRINGVTDSALPDWHCRAGSPDPALDRATRPWRGSATPPCTTRRSRGSVVIFVLGIILLTALLLTRFIERAQSELLAEARHAQLPALRGEAYSALQVSLAVLADYIAVDGGLRSPAQGWGEPLAQTDYTPSDGLQVAVQVEDESARLSLPGADPVTLLELLVVAGCTDSEAERIADAIVAWTRAEHPPRFAESDPDFFALSDPALVPPHAPLRSFGELQLLPAVRDVLMDGDSRWNEIGRVFLANLSLHRFTQVNLNTAGPEMLLALGLDANAILARRDPGLHGLTDPAAGIFQSVADVATLTGDPAAAGRIGVETTCLRISITVLQGGRSFHLLAVVQPGGGTARPPANTGPETTPPTTPRAWTSKSIDSPFRILEIQENHGY